MPTDGPPQEGNPGGIRFGSVGGSVNLSAQGDIVGGHKITNITISVEAVTQRPLVTASPYRGLNRFEAKNEHLFFGRDQLIKSLREQLEKSNVLLVLGASGSGKSSVVRAGLLPKLSKAKGTQFSAFTFVPDRNPFLSFSGALQNAGFTQAQTCALLEGAPDIPAKLIHLLQRPGEEWLLFIDQFEEVFTVCDEATRRAFIAALVGIAKDSAGSTKLVLAMRADFFDRFSPFPEFTGLIEKNISLVADMQVDELRQAIEQPAAQHGMVFEPGLVEEIIKDVQGQAGSLPLLQYTLDLLWEEERRSGGLADRHLNTAPYRELGGVRGALQKRANEFYQKYDDGPNAKTASPKQEIVRQVFLRLVDLAGESGNDGAWRPVRRRAPKTSFATEAEQELLQALIDEKLLVSNREREGTEATVEVAHEALFTSWERLRKWIDGGKQVIFVKNRFSDDARRWHRRRAENGADAGAEEELLTGSRLGQALEMRARGDFMTIFGAPGLPVSENQFLDASAARREQLAQQERDRQQRELEKERQLREVDAARAREAEQRAKDAEQHAREQDESRRQLEKRRKRLQVAVVAAAVLAIAAAGLAFSSARNARLAKESAVKANDHADLAKNNEAKAKKNEKTANENAELAKNNEAKAKANEKIANDLLREASRSDFASAQARLDEEKWQEAVAYLGRSLRYDPMNFNAHTALWLTLRYGTRHGGILPLQVWQLPADFGSLRSLVSRHYQEIEGNFGRPSLSPDGKRFVIASANNTARVWDVATGQPVGTPLQHQQIVTSAEFSPDGRRVVTASWDKTARIWNAMGGPVGAPLQHQGRVDSANFSPDSKRVVTISESDDHKIHSAQVWDAATGRPVGAALLHKEYVQSASFSPDNTRVVTASSDRTVQIWNAETGHAEGASLKHPASVSSASFSPDGTRILTVSESKDDMIHTARIWDAATRLPIGLPMEHSRSLTSATFSPDGTRVVTASNDKIARVWDATTGEPVGAPMRHDEYVFSASFSPDGTRVVTASADSTARVWDVATGDPVGAPLRHPRAVRSASFSPDGLRIVTVSRSKDNTLQAWEIDQHPDRVAASGVFNDTVRVWDAATGNPIGALTHQAWVRTASFSRDGTRIVTASDDKTALIWDATTGQPVGTPLAHEHEVHIAGFSPDGTRVLTASESKEKIHIAQIWDATNGLRIGVPMEHRQRINSADFSPDGNRVVTASSDGKVQVWNAKTGLPLVAPLEHKVAVTRAAFSPDGERVVTVGVDETAQVWDVNPVHVKPERRIGDPLPQHRITSASFSPDGNRVVTSSFGKNMLFWDAESGQCVGIPSPQQIDAHSFNSSPDGTRFAIFDEDSTLQFSDAATGQFIGGRLPTQNNTSSLSFSPDGTRIVTAGADCTARIWDIASLEALADGVVERLATFCSGAKLDPQLGTLQLVVHDKRMALWKELEPALVRSPEWLMVAKSFLLKSPDSPVSLRLPLTLRESATRLVQTGNQDSLRDVLSFDPGHPLIQIALAATEKESARAEFLREYGVSHLPGDANFCRRAAGMLLDQKDKPRATRAIEKASSLDPNHPDLPGLRARLRRPNPTSATRD